MTVKSTTSLFIIIFIVDSQNKDVHLKSGEDAGLLGVGGVTSGAGDAAETLGFTVESISDAHHPTHLTGR